MIIRLILAVVAIALVVLAVGSFCDDCSAEARTFLRELVRALR